MLFDDVSEREGTGVVHAAPGAGEADFELSKREGLTVIAPLNEFGVFVDGFDWLTGRSVFDVNDDIYRSLKDKGLFHRLESYSHRYPVCWRCDTELVFRLVDEWFISMDELRDLIARVTRNVNWVPAFGLQRELDWLRNMDDWMISKKRYWGLALPIYKCECGHFEVIGSETELEARAIEGWDQFEGHSPHRPWIDAVKIQCAQCGKAVSRIRDVGNPWLDAGIVPFSTMGYRDDRSYWRDWFPGDLISESFPGQFRNWFYSLLTMSTVLEDSEPCKAVFSYAMMRDEHGEEMHKSKGNAIWFEDAAEKMGVDSMRWVYTQAPAGGQSQLRLRRRRRRAPELPDPALERLLVLRDLRQHRRLRPVHAGAAGGAEAGAGPVDHLGAERAGGRRHGGAGAVLAAGRVPPVRELRRLPVELVRPPQPPARFWKSEADDDKLAAHSTLYECLVTLTRLLAPFVPFVTEEMYRNLARGPANGRRESVHLESYPVADESKIDRGLSEATRLAMRLSSLGRAARSKAGIKVRQPLDRAVVALRAESERGALERIKDQVRDELNVKEVAAMEDDGEVVGFHVEAVLSKVGPRFGPRTREVVAALQAMDSREVWRRVDSGRPVEAGEFTLEPDEVSVTRTDAPGYVSATEADYTVAVTTEISRELELEGLARELVHVVQNMRRSAGFDIADHIDMYVTGDAELDELLAAHADYIQRETLADTVAENTGARVRVLRVAQGQRPRGGRGFGAAVGGTSEL